MAAPDYAEAHNNLGVLQVSLCAAAVPSCSICLHEVASAGEVPHIAVQQGCATWHGIRAAWHGMA